MNKKKLAIAIASVGVSFFLFSSASYGMSENSLMQQHGTKESLSKKLKKDVPNAREEAVKEAGQSEAAAWGYYEEMKKLESQVKTHTAALDQVFNFTPFLLNGHVLPPVIEEADQSARFVSPTQANFAQVEFRIVHPAQIVSALPNWRNWLLLPITKPKKVNSILLPVNEKEEIWWRKSVQKGWNQGVEQAKLVMIDQVYRLEREMRGIILFEKLRSLGMVQGPVVVSGAPKIVVNGNTMSLNTRTFAVTLPASFVGESKDYHPLLRGGN